MIHYRIRIGLICLLSGAAAALNASTVADIYRALEERGVPFDTNAVQESAVEGMLKALDPRAKIVIMPRAPDRTSERIEPVETAERWSDDICYLKIKGLYAGAGDEIAECLLEWTHDGLSGLIMDLRGAGGESIEAVDRIASLIVGGETLLYNIKDGYGRIVESHHAEQGTRLSPDVSMILLLDNKTRDASEALTAVMKGKARVMLLGSRTSGNSGLRESLPLSETERLCVATRWIVPADGAEYETVGVAPDVVVSNSTDNKAVSLPSKENENGKPLSDKARMGRYLMLRVAGDAALCRATDILLGLKALGIPGTAATTNAAITSGGEERTPDRM